MDFNHYNNDGFHDEMFAHDGKPRSACKALFDRLQSLSEGDLVRYQQSAERALYNMGITFRVYKDNESIDQIFPFDIIPRILGDREWRRVERGLIQRITALNLFLQDIYNDKKILKDRIIPEDVVYTAAAYRPECEGLTPLHGIWCHITGTDLVRDGSGNLCVLEDNLRCPSGVSYVLENRRVMMNTFPKLFSDLRVKPVSDYAGKLLDMLQYVAPESSYTPTVVVLTPGIYNSAYFEHSFMAQQMGVELVEGRDLVVFDGYVHMRTTTGFQRVDVIYRRIDDDFIDPLTFRSDSILGVPGLFQVYKEGRVTLANAIGNGVADDKVVYAYVEKMIRYYLDEDPILPNVQTYLCWQPGDRSHVLENLDKFVVKAANESGGYGMLVGPHATQAEREAFRARIEANPRNYIAQPTLELSRVPVICGDHLEGRHVDLRPYILYGRDIYVLPGGLTRVALKKGSLVVNSSQGGGSKDTWVVMDSGTRDGTLPVEEAHA